MNNVTSIVESQKPSLVETFLSVETDLKTRLIERTQIIRGVLLATLSGEHAFLLGPPGTAKSLTIELFCNAVSGARYFRTLMSKFSQPEEIFGPPSLKMLQNDKYGRIVEGYAPDAHLVFLDEFWRGSASIIETLLTLANERIFKNGSQTLNCPLISLFIASNELPANSGLDAAYDRFLLRYYVGRIKDPANFETFLSLDETEQANIKPQLDLSDIAEAQTQVHDVSKTHIRSTLRDLWNKFEAIGFEFSDRRWGKAQKVMRANAWLHNRTEVTSEDLEVLADIMWNKPAERRQILNTILSIASPGLEKALEFFDMAVEIHKDAIADGSTEAGMEANNKFKDEVLPEMEKLPTSDRLDDLVQKVRVMQREIAVKCLGF